MKKYLSSLNVIITRPLSQSRGLQDQIIEQGGHPILFPTIAIEGISNDKVASAVNEISQYDLLIFLSQNAVTHFVPLLKGNLTSLIAAIGPATANALARYHVSVDLMPSQYDSEHLLPLLEHQHLTNKKVLIISGAGGRTYLANRLKILGANVERIAVYRRICPVVTSSLLEEVTQKKSSILVSTSCEGFDNLLKICNRYSLTEWLSQMMILVISQRIKNFIEAKGFKSNYLLLAENGTDQAILDSLIKWYANSNC